MTRGRDGAVNSAAGGEGPVRIENGELVVAGLGPESCTFGIVSGVQAVAVPDERS
jgi:hypothetical protein